MNPNCLSYCKDTGKCNNVRRFCPFKSADLTCLNGGVCPDPEKEHNYNSNGVGGHSYVDNTVSKKGGSDV